MEQSEHTTWITRLTEQDERYATSSKVQDEVHVLQMDLKTERSTEVTVAYILNELCGDKQHYTVIVAPEHRGFIHPLARRRQTRVTSRRIDELMKVKSDWREGLRYWVQLRISNFNEVLYEVRSSSTARSLVL